MKYTKTTTMRITRDECRLFSILIDIMNGEKIYDSLAFRNAKLNKDDYFKAIENMSIKFMNAAIDNRRNSEKVKSNDFDDLMARLTKKYK